MPARIPDLTRRGVVGSYLSVDPRRVTATKHGISEGAVSNIVEQWRRQEGPQLANILRDLSVTLSKSGITPSQCAQGHRLAMIMKRMGIDEEDHERFLSDISKRYVEVGLDSGLLVEHINELHSFLEINRGQHGRSSIYQVQEIIEKKKEEERKLYEEISTSKSLKKDLEKSIVDLQFEKAKVESELKWDAELVRNLKANGFQFETVPRFVSAAMLMKERGYNIFEITEKFSKFEEISDACATIEIRVGGAQLKREELDREIRNLQEYLARNSQSLRELKFLDEIGFGLPEFKQLHYLLDEVAQQDGVTAGNAAVKKFFDDLQNHFYDYVFLGKTVAELKAERARLSGSPVTDFTTYLGQILQGYQKPSPKRSDSYETDTKTSTAANNEAEAVEKKAVLNGRAAPSIARGDARSVSVDSAEDAKPNSILETPKSYKVDSGNDWRGEQVEKGQEHLDLASLVFEAVVPESIRRKILSGDYSN
jgi:hypothetical protein